MPFRSKRPSDSEPISTNDRTYASGSKRVEPSRPQVAKVQVEPTPPAVTPGRYQELEVIGRGGCGVVVRALDLQMQREVVIKRVIPSSAYARETLVRFFNEAKITGRLQHPGIVPVHEIGTSQSDGAPFYVMKLLQGETLSKHIANQHVASSGAATRRSAAYRSLHELLNRFHQVCLTVAYAHGQGVIHRDIKPSNIMIGEFGETIVLDWGLAKELPSITTSTAHQLPNDPLQHQHPLQQLEQIEQQINELSPVDEATAIAGLEAHQSPPFPTVPSASKRPMQSAKAKVRTRESQDQNLTRTGDVLGTASYMSPEQARGETAAVDARSDVFSLGVVLYEILSGVSPFRSNSVQTTLKRVAEAQYAPLGKCKRGVPRALDAICNRALSLNPQDRYADAGELAADLQSYLAGDRVRAYREPWWGRLDRIASKHVVVVRSVFIALVVIAMLSIVAAACIDGSRQAEMMARKHAQQETEQKNQALILETIAHERATDQLIAARKAVDAWLIDLSGDLQFYPGMDTVRNQLLEKARQFYSANASASIHSVSDRLERAKAEIRLGDLARLSGDLKEARLQYQSALGAIQELQPQSVESLSASLSVEHANTLLGFALCSLEDEVGFEPKWKQAELAAGQAKNAMDLFPGSSEAKKTWARSQQCLARVIACDLQFEQAATVLEKPIALAEWLYAQGQLPSEHRLLTSLLADQADMRRQCKQNEAWTEALQRLVQLYSQRMRNTPGRPDLLEARSHAYTHLGNAKLLCSDPQAARAEYELASQDMQQAWDLLYGDPYFMENLAITSINLANATVESGDLELAEGIVRKAIERMREIVARDGSSNHRIVQMVNCYLLLVRCLAEKSLEESNAILENCRILLNHLREQGFDSGQVESLSNRRDALAEKLPTEQTISLD